MSPAAGKDFRRRALARIHLAKAQLGWSDDVYRGVLLEVAGVSSARDLDTAGLNRMLDHVVKCGFKGKAGYPGRPHNFGDEDRTKLLLKIEAILSSAHKSWNYADGVARRACGIDRVVFCQPPHLHRIVGILLRNARRYHWEGVKL